MSREEGQLLAQEESQETDAQVTEPPAPGDRGHGKARLFPTTAGGYCGAGLAGRPERGLQAAGRGSEEMESGPPPAMLSGVGNGARGQRSWAHWASGSRASRFCPDAAVSPGEVHKAPK